MKGPILPGPQKVHFNHCLHDAHFFLPCHPTCVKGLKATHNTHLDQRTSPDVSSVLRPSNGSKNKFIAHSAFDISNCLYCCYDHRTFTATVVVSYH